MIWLFKLLGFCEHSWKPKYGVGFGGIFCISNCTKCGKEELIDQDEHEKRFPEKFKRNTAGGIRTL